MRDRLGQALNPGAPSSLPQQAMEGVAEEGSSDEDAPHTYKDEQLDAKSAFLQVGSGPAQHLNRRCMPVPHESPS